jgi:hypothetical protein
MTDFLQAQLEAYRQAAWQIDHRRAMQCRDLEDWLDFGISLLGAIHKIDARYRERVRSKEQALDRHVVEGIQQLYELWFNPCEHLLREIERFEADGFALENAQSFRDACASSPVPGLEPEKLLAAQQQFDQGRGRPLTEVMNGIRNRTVG